MKRLMLAALVAMFALGFAAWARGEGIFKDDAKKEGAAVKAVEPAAQPEAAAEAKDVLPAANKKRMEDKIAMAEKMLQAAKAELDKPEGKADLKKADGFRLRASQFFLGASLEAKTAAAATRKEDQKAAIAEQFEKPNKQKAIGILLELAAAAHEKKDIRTAVGLYKEVLKIDPENVTAKEKLEAIQEELKNAPKDTKASGSKGGGDNTNRNDPSKDPSGSRTGIPKNAGDWRGGKGNW